MTMSDRRYERVVVIRGFKYIKLKSGRFINAWETLEAAERANTDLGRAVSRTFKLVDNDYDLERLTWFAENLQSYAEHLLEEIEKRRGVKTKKERIALLRHNPGRGPEEAELYRRKADELEAQLGTD